MAPKENNDSNASLESITKDQLLNVQASLKQTLNKLKTSNAEENTNDESTSHLSLLSLKNDSMLSYIQSIAYLMLEENEVQIGAKVDDDSDEEEETIANDINKYEWNTIVQKTIIEKAIKPIEKKLQYQLDKLCKVYYNEFERLQKEQQKQEKKTQIDEDKSGEEDNSDSEENSSDDEQMYKPNIETETKIFKNRASRMDEAEGEREEQISKQDIVSGKYQPIKVSQNIQFEDKFDYNADKNAKKNKLQSMEEYLQEMQDKPEWESSIGANLQKSGKKSMSLKSQHVMNKERELDEYEETNFIRLNRNSLPGQNNKAQKKLRKQKELRDRVNVIAGEDFSIFNNSGAQKRKFEGSTTRGGNKKPKGAWDRAKKRL
ncbi:uncharacterized protein HGUI_03784 [Hanseniaspora guilliermondii]|uniref:Uncharacterized protein n=1 Tax=Hanseniaspora guilliermondii TaxID=56406 RepID=A0A1L0D328_9ASCO|nr:uncharacterized protein HGUI_03784 [Hanseniaspora guilliermondii]